MNISQILFKKSLAGACLILAVAACGPQENGKTKEKVMQEAAAPDDIEDLNAKIIERPNDPNLYVRRSLLYRDRGEFEQAIRDAERAIAIDSTVAYFRSVLAEVYYLKRDLRDARLNFERAVRLDPTDTDALLQLGQVNFLLRRYEESLSSVNDALRQNDKLAQGYFIKGMVYTELGDTVLAKSSFQTATEVNPEYYEAFIQLGQLSAYQGDPLALAYFNTAITLRPASAEALYNKGMFLQAGAKYDEAMEVYRRMMEVDPNGFLGYYNAGYLKLTEYAEYDSALYFFNQVLMLQPGYMDAKFNKGVCYEEKGDRAKAVEIYREVLAEDPDYTLAAKGLERLLE